MAVLKGKDGSISAGLNNLANITSFSINEEADTLETTAMGNAGYKTFVGSLKSWLKCGPMPKSRGLTFHAADGSDMREHSNRC